MQKIMVDFGSQRDTMSSQHVRHAIPRRLLENNRLTSKNANPTRSPKIVRVPTLKSRLATGDELMNGENI